jgi:serine/threonine-protein kinase
MAGRGVEGRHAVTDGRWERVAGLFEQAVALPVEERSRFLARACGDDVALLASVQELLAADASAPAVLDATPEQMAAAFATATLPAAEGWRVGPYLLRRELGRGGMGVVYLAEREDLRNTVAVKLLQRGPASAVHGAWFRREQAVHAQLEHPHIARLLDAGVADDGTPWLVMEYVEGSAIDRHCDDHRLSVPQRLAMFEKVADAVAYAHRNLVVHRDIKPSNILVTATGEPKLVDFGIAKMLSPEAGPQGSLAHTAGSVLTLAYASPEQLKGGHLTTATDVYQLGLLLHELLTGLPACDLQGRPLDPIARLRDHDPARPSALITQTVVARGDDQGGLPPAARAALRRTTPERLRRMLEGDLDTITLKAIRSDPRDRYATAQELADDIRRHRDGLPVLARPGSLGYRLGKLVRRHRITATLLATLVIVGIAAAVTLGIQSRRVARERDRADQFSHLLEGLIYGADPLGIADSQSARTVLDRTARQARAGVAAEPEVWGRLLVVVGRTYQNMGHLEEAIAVQQEALAALGRSSGNGSPLMIEALRSLGLSLVRRGDLDAGVARLEEAVARSRRAGAGSRAQLGKSLGDLATALGFMGGLDSAAALYRGALAVLAGLPDSGGGDFDRLRVEFGNLLLQGSQLAEAEDLIGGAVARLTAQVGPEGGATLHAKTELADVYLKRGKLTPAERLATEVLEVRRRINREPHDHLARALLQHGRSAAENRRLAEAERSMREAIAVWSRLNGSKSFAVAYAQVQLAEVIKRAGRAAEALVLEQNSLAQYIELSGPRSPGAVYTTARLAHSEHLLGQLDSSERRFREVLPLLDSTPSGQGRLVRPLTDFADLLATRGKCVEAEPHLRRAMAIADQGWGIAHPVSLRPRRLLGTCLGRARQYPAAEEILLAAYRLAGDAGEYAPRQQAEMAGALAGLYEAWGRSEVAARYRAESRRRIAVSH